jgi:hypothetical protein
MGQLTTWLIVGALALVGIGVALSGPRIKKEGFDYKGIHVELIGDENGWVWNASPVGWEAKEHKSVWEWIKWPIISRPPGKLFKTTEDASLDAIRVLDERLR